MSEENYSDYGESQIGYFNDIYNECDLSKPIKTVYNHTKKFLVKDKKLFVAVPDDVRETMNEKSGKNRRNIYIPYDKDYRITKVLGGINCETNGRFTEDPTFYGYLAYTSCDTYLLLADQQILVTFKLMEKYEIIGFISYSTSRMDNTYLCAMIITNNSDDASADDYFFVLVTRNDEKNKCIKINNYCDENCVTVYMDYFEMLDTKKSKQFEPDFITHKTRVILPSRY
jgi:hypothetical protein